MTIVPHSPKKLEDIRETIGDFKNLDLHWPEASSLEEALTGRYKHKASHSGVQLYPLGPSFYSAHQYTAEQLEQIIEIWESGLSRIRESISTIPDSYAVPTSMEITYPPVIDFLYHGWSSGVVVTMRHPHTEGSIPVTVWERNNDNISTFRETLVAKLVLEFENKLGSCGYPLELQREIGQLFHDQLDQETLANLPTDKLGSINKKWRFFGIGARKKGQVRIIIDENRYKRPGIEVVPIVIADWGFSGKQVFAVIDGETWWCKRRKYPKHIEQKKMTRVNPETDSFSIRKVEEIMMDLFSKSED